MSCWFGSPFNATLENTERKMRVKITAALLTALCVTAVVSAQSVLTKATRPIVTSGQAKLVGALPATYRMGLNVVLPIQNNAAMQAQFKDVYNPKSPNFHKFISPKEFASLYNPTEAQYTAAVNYFKSQGFTITGGQWLTRNILINGTVAQIESTFHVKLNSYKDPSTGIAFFANDRQPMTGLSFPVWSVTGLDSYSNPKPLISENPALRGGTPQSVHSLQTTGSGPFGAFLGSDMRAAYGGDLVDNPGGYNWNGNNQAIGIWEYLGTNLQDLNHYYHVAYGSSAPNVYLESTDWSPVACIYTKADHFCDDTEQTLDLTQALGVAPGAQAIMYVGATDSAIFSGIVNDVNNNWGYYQYAYPSVVSISWYWSPSDIYANDPVLQELALNGVTVLAASGDYGAYLYTYPADDPYVVAVGGTQLFTNGSGGPWASELTWADSGGGASNNGFAIPNWQTPQSSPGLITTANGASSTLRNGPDVSADAYWNYLTCADMQSCLANAYGGTSFAAPLWAGWIADYNQSAVFWGGIPSSNPPTLGLFTPAMYIDLQTNMNNNGGYPTILHDITSGPSNYLYYPEPGFDLVTGWGTPDFYLDNFMYSASGGTGCYQSGC